MLGKWAKTLQFNANGMWIPFFGPPPPPPPAHNHGLLQPFGPAPPPPSPPPANNDPHDAHYHQHFFNGAYLGLLPTAFPLPHLPAFPIIITLPTINTANTAAPPQHTPLLALPWYDTTTAASPPPTVTFLPQARRGGATAPKRVARKVPRTTMVAKRNSARLAAKDSGAFELMSTKAERLHKLRDDLSGCSKKLKKQVKKDGLLKKTKEPLTRRDLRSLASAAGLDAKFNVLGKKKPTVPNV